MYFDECVDKKKIGNNLKKAIKRQYGTVKEYSEQTGQIYETLNSWVSGNRLPTVGDMIANCTILDIPLEYMLTGTNLEYVSAESSQKEEDWYSEKARFNFPNIIFADFALIMPLLDLPLSLDIVNRIADCGNNLYVYNLLRRHIKSSSEEWKHCVYTLQCRNSPLTEGFQILTPTPLEKFKWSEAYFEAKFNFYSNLQNLLSVIFLEKQKDTSSNF